MKITLEEIKKEQDEFREAHLIWCPWSVNHGLEIGFVPERMHAKIEIANLNDFIEFLFEHSEHCDHISQSDAWDEFLVECTLITIIRLLIIGRGAENQFKGFLTDNSDEKIKQLVAEYCSKSNDAYEIATKEVFENFAKWMRDKLKGGENEK